MTFHRFSVLCLGAMLATCFSSRFAHAASAAPVFTSPPFASANPAGTGEPIHFSASATGAAPFSYTWTFGDSLSLTGSVVQHQYNAAGTYNVTVTVSDSNNVTAKASLTVTIVAPLVTSSSPLDTFDSDGDGFSNLIESELGTNPNNASSTPAGNHPATAATIKGVASFKGKLSLDYGQPAKKVNSGAFSVAVNVPNGFSASSLTIGFDIDGISKIFVLDSKGKKGKSGKSTLTASIKKVKQAVPARKNDLSFDQLKMIIKLFDDDEDGTFSNDWIDAIDLLRPPDTSIDIKDQKVKGKLTITAPDGSVYTKDVEGTFNRKDGVATITYSASGN